MKLVKHETLNVQTKVASTSNYFLDKTDEESNLTAFICSVFLQLDFIFNKSLIVMNLLFFSQYLTNDSIQCKIKIYLSLVEISPTGALTYLCLPHGVMHVVKSSHI